MSEADRAQALERYQHLRPALEDGVPLAQVARAHQIPLRTAQRWVAPYRTYGLAGLIHAPRADRGQHRRIAPELQRLIEGLALQRPPPSAATIHRQIGPIAIQHGWPIPSYTSVYALIQQLEPALITLAHHGPKVYGETFDLIHQREASQPNEIWQADHTPLDVWLIGEGGQPIRPWLTVIEDDYSRAIAGYYLLTQAPSILHTALALRQAIWRKSEPHWHICGIPQIFYTDHGSDFIMWNIRFCQARIGGISPLFVGALFFRERKLPPHPIAATGCREAALRRILEEDQAATPEVVASPLLVDDAADEQLPF